MPRESQIWFFFNELSARVPAPTNYQGRRRMDDMVIAVATLMNGRSATFVTVVEPNLWTVELANGYTVTNWLSEADPEQRALLLTIENKSEFPVEAGEALRNRFYLSEFVLSRGSEGESGDRLESMGLGAA